jgi:hypothetical protein
MRKASSALALALAFAVPASALAETRVIGDLSEGALLGPIGSTAQLQNEFTTHNELIAQASDRLGLSRADYDEVREDVQDGLARYVQLPRHLDGMAGSHNGVAFAVHDIEIPAHVYGWEVDINKPDGVVRVFMPNQCGNISYVRVPKRRVLAAALPFHVAAAPTPAPVPVLPPPAPVAAAPAPAPVAPIIPAAVPAASHTGWLPLLALIPIGFLFHGGGSTSVPIGGGPAPITPGGRVTFPIHGVTIPAPIPTICPPPAVKRP